MQRCLLVLWLLFLSACAAVPTSIATPNHGPHAIVKAMYSALNAHDLDAAMKYFSDDALVIVRRRPYNFVLTSKDQIRAWLGRDMQQGVLSEFSDLASSGNNSTVLHKRIDAAEVISQEDETFVVIDGKIKGIGLDAENVVRYAFRALNDKNVELALRFFSDHAACSLTGKSLTGRDALRSAMESLVDAGDVFDTDVHQVEGYYEVRWDLTIYDRTGKIISRSQKTSFLDDGKIVVCEKAE